MKRRTAIASRVALTTAGALLLPARALAHTGHGASGTAAGLLHPVTGLDHLLAMVAVGIWAVQLGGRMVWKLPLTFVSFMLVGGMLSVVPIPKAVVERAILTSVVVLGALIAASLRSPQPLAMLLVGGFALFHGHAHGSELQPGQSAVAYGAGFLLSTVTLHAAGVAASLALQNVAQGPRLVRVGGLGVMTCGVFLCVWSI